MAMDALTLNVDARNAAQAGDAALFGHGKTRLSGSDFASVLGKTQQGADEDAEAFARRSAENFVAIGLVQPLLKQLRDSNHTAPPFGPTQGEKQFQGLADAELAQRMVHASRFGIVDKIADSLMQRARQKAEASAADTSVNTGDTK